MSRKLEKIKKTYCAPGTGFVGVVFLCIALIALVIAAIATMARSQNKSPGLEKDRMAASIVISHMADFQSGYDRMLVEGINPVWIRTDDSIPGGANAPAGMFDPSPNARYSPYHRLPKSAAAPLPNTTDSFQYGYDAYVFTSGKKKMRAGTSTGADDVVFAYNPIREDVCRSINSILHGDKIGDVLPASTVSYSSYSSDQQPTTEGNVTDPRLERLEGCIKTNESVYVYYRVLKAY